MKQNLRDNLITKTAQDLSLLEDWVDKAITFQFKEANKATHLHSSIEISGFGTFWLSRNKTERRLKKMEDIRDALQKRETLTPDAEKKLQGVLKEIQFYQAKLQL